MKRKLTLASIAIVLLLSSGRLWADATFNPATGKLHIPVMKVVPPDGTPLFYQEITLTQIGDSPTFRVENPKVDIISLPLKSSHDAQFEGGFLKIYFVEVANKYYRVQLIVYSWDLVELDYVVEVDKFKTIELCTAVDGSGSIEQDDFQLQLDGLANAVADPAVIPRDSTVTLSVVQFAETVQVEIEPTLITDVNVALSVRDKIKSIQSLNGPTNIAGAIDLCTQQFSFSSAKQVIDVSGGVAEKTYLRVREL